MPNIGFPEILALMVLALLIFGAKRLPEIGQSMGKGIREFKKSLTETQDAVMKPGDRGRRMIDGDHDDESEDVSAERGGEPKRLSQ